MIEPVAGPISSAGGRMEQATAPERSVKPERRQLET